MQTIVVIGMGEMGSGIAGRLVECGARVLSPIAERSAASRDRAVAAGVELLHDEALFEGSDLVLSIVPPVSAASVAARYRSLIEQAATSPMFIDCNAISPLTMNRIAAGFTARGLPVGDGGIIGVAPRPGYSPRLLLSGPVSEQAAMLAALGLDAHVMSEVVGEASALKMAFAGITKGTQAIGAAMAIGAQRAGALEALIAELRHAVPDLYAWLAKMLPIMIPKAYRWEDEMNEIATFLQPEKGAVEMLTGAGHLYRQIAADHAGPPSNLISAITHFSGR